MLQGFTTMLQGFIMLHCYKVFAAKTNKPWWAVITQTKDYSAKQN